MTVDTANGVAPAPVEKTFHHEGHEEHEGRAMGITLFRILRALRVLRGENSALQTHRAAYVAAAPATAGSGGSFIVTRTTSVSVCVSITMPERWKILSMPEFSTST